MPDLGAPEILVILAVVLLLFGGRKLPELARGSGRALRIFKSELRESEVEDKKAVTEADPTVHEAEIVDDDKK